MTGNTIPPNPGWASLDVPDVVDRAGKGSVKDELESWMNTIRGLDVVRDSSASVQIAPTLLGLSLRDLDDTLCMLGTLSDHVQGHLDTFSADDGRRSKILDAIAIRKMCTQHRPAFVAALLLAGARLFSAPVAPRQVFPGRFAYELALDAIGTKQTAQMRSIVERVRGLDADSWHALTHLLAALITATDEWAHWPNPEIAGRVCAGLAALAPSWSEAREQEETGKSRTLRRDPAFRRAMGWHTLLTNIFERIASPRGDLRLTVEYGMAVLDHCCRPDHGAASMGPAAAELAVIEIFSNIDHALGCPRVQLEVGYVDRRKRIQRARLRVFTNWRQNIDLEQWQSETLPQLIRLAGRLERP